MPFRKSEALACHLLRTTIMFFLYKRTVIGKGLSSDALGAEEYCFFGKSEDFAIRLSNGHLKVALRKFPNELYGPYGKYSIYLRKGNVYTKVTFDVNL